MRNEIEGSRLTTLGDRAAFAAAALMSVGVVVIQAMWMLRAGPLWRDEIGAVGIAVVEPLSTMFSDLLFDSFPIGHYLLMRAWMEAFSATDTSLRVFGMVVAIVPVAIVWWAARVTNVHAPLLALSLYLLHPIVIRYSSSIRAYGLGMALCLATWVLIWKVTRDGGPGNWASASVAALLSVHVSYQNWFFLAAMCTASAIVSARIGQRRRAVGVFAIGLSCAVTVIPYLSIVERAGAWNELARLGLSPLLLAQHWQRFFGLAGTPHLLAWMAVTGIVLWRGVVAWQRSLEDAKSRDVLFASLTAILVTVAFGAFLLVLGFLVNPWYFLPWVAIAAVAAEPAVVATLHGWVRPALAAVAVIVALTTVPAIRSNLSMQYTGVVDIAKVVEARAEDRDLVIVYPWEFGITFNRYYGGRTEWKTMPPIMDHRWHRYDQYAEVLRSGTELEPFLAEIDRVLESGGRIWLITKMRFETRMGSMKGIPRVDQMWRVEVRRRLYERARRMEGPLKPATSVLEYEDPWLEVWKALPTSEGGNPMGATDPSAE